MAVWNLVYKINITYTTGKTLPSAIRSHFLNTVSDYTRSRIKSSFAALWPLHSLLQKQPINKPYYNYLKRTQMLCYDVNHLRAYPNTKQVFYISLNIKHKWVSTKHDGRALHCCEYMYQSSGPFSENDIYFCCNTANGIFSIPFQLLYASWIVLVHIFNPTKSNEGS